MSYYHTHKLWAFPLHDSMTYFMSSSLDGMHIFPWKPLPTVRPFTPLSYRTLVGAGLKNKDETRRRLDSLIPSHLAHIPENVKTFEPKSSSVTTSSGRKITYENLVVATGLQINWSTIQGLEKALADPASGVSSIYSYNTCDKVWRDVDALRSGKAIFTQPAGVIKCAGGKSHSAIPLRGEKLTSHV